ncbi:hypothetical protein [Halomonas sp. 3H]|uniref:hypothetical protein n=1 Tax=Halomonas sp. 3H TaxID=2952527 RepID=UPI0020B89EE3|nr:hypothetical protein [Halomonas sp. 3H]
MLKVNKFFTLIVLISLFFPYVGFVSGIDVQPLFVFFLLPSVFLALSVSVPLKATLVFLLSIFTLILYGLVFGYSVTSKFILTYLFAVTTVYFIYIYIKNYNIDIGLKFVFFVLSCYIGVGLVQLFFMPEFLAGLVHRDSAVVHILKESGRGARSLTGEPSHLGKVITLMNVLMLYIIMKENSYGFSSRLNMSFVASFLLLALSGLVARSAYAFAVHLSVVLFFFVSVMKAKTVIRIISSISLMFIFFILLHLFDVMSGTRIEAMFLLAFNNPEALLQQGAARRVFNIPLSLNNLRYFGIFGSGERESVYNAVLWTPIGDLSYFANYRNLGGLIEFVMRLGVFSFPFLLVFLLFSIRVLRLNSFSDLFGYSGFGFFVLYSFLITMVQDGPFVLPIGWFVFIYIVLDSDRERCGLPRNSGHLIKMN